ncbi:MAG: hypothetical protein H6581_23405 [Bacteroidia bacterium]|nr:hypothetical protein [Bacteroidia bacterium]
MSDSDLTWQDKAVPESVVKLRIRDWGLNHRDQYCLAFAFKKTDVDALLQDYNGETVTGLYATFGFTLDYPLAPGKTELELHKSLTVLLCGVTGDPTNGCARVLSNSDGFGYLGYDRSQGNFDVPTGNDTCLQLEFGKNDLTAYTEESGLLRGNVSSLQGNLYRANFRNYIQALDNSGNPPEEGSSFTWSESNKCACSGRWMRAYTYDACIINDFLDLAPDGGGLRFYMGVSRVDDNPEGDFYQHTLAVCAIDANYNDICVVGADNYVDWAQPCPNICPD